MVNSSPNARLTNGSICRANESTALVSWRCRNAAHSFESGPRRYSVSAASRDCRRSPQRVSTASTLGGMSMVNGVEGCFYGSSMLFVFWERV